MTTDRRDTPESVPPPPASSSIMASVLAGLVAGLLAVTFMFSYSAVILTGDLAPFVPRLTGHFLLGGVVLALVVALRSQYLGVVALPQNNPTAVLAVIVASVLAGDSALEPVELFATVLALIAISTVVGGVMLWMVGRFRLAQIGNYVPYPVIAGFLAATGWLLFKGSFGVMSGVAFDLGNLADQGDVAELWVPGAVFAIVLWPSRNTWPMRSLCRLPSSVQSPGSTRCWESRAPLATMRSMMGGSSSRSAVGC